MPDATQKLALEIAAQSEQALDALDKVKKSINEVNKNAEASIAVDKKVVATQQAMTRSSTGLTSAQRKAGSAINATSTDLERMVGTLTEGDQAAQQLTGSVVSGASAFLMMGPAAATAIIGIQGIQLAIEQITSALDALKKHDFAAKIISDVRMVKEMTFSELTAATNQIATYVDDLAEKHAESTRQLERLESEKTSNIEKFWIKMHTSNVLNAEKAAKHIEEIRSHVAEKIQIQTEAQIKLEEEAVNRALGGHHRLITSYDDMMEYIRLRKQLIGMTAEEEKKLLIYTQQYIDVVGTDKAARLLNHSHLDLRRYGQGSRAIPNLIRLLDASAYR